MCSVEWRRVADMLLRQTERDFSFPINTTFQLVSEWRMLAPAMMGSDMHQTSQWIAGEVLETLTEIELIESGENSRLKFFEKELIDILVFLEQAMRILGVEPNQHKAQQLVNGLASTSRAYEKLVEVAGNLPTDRSENGVQFLLGGIISILKYGPKNIDALQITKQVIRKNTRNYPPEYLSGKDPITGQELGPDELLLQYEHAKSLLRAIRDATGNNPDGLDPRHHQRHADLFKDIRHTQECLSILRLRLSV